MNLPEVPTLVQGVAILVGAFLGWMALRIVLKVTARLFTVGCVAVLVLIAIGGIAGWLS